MRGGFKRDACMTIGIYSLGAFEIYFQKEIFWSVVIMYCCIAIYAIITYKKP